MGGAGPVAGLWRAFGGPLAGADHAGRSVASAITSAFAPRLVPLVWYLGASTALSRPGCLHLPAPASRSVRGSGDG